MECKFSSYYFLKDYNQISKKKSPTLIKKISSLEDIVLNTGFSMNQELIAQRMQVIKIFNCK